METPAERTERIKAENDAKVQRIIAAIGVRTEIELVLFEDDDGKQCRVVGDDVTAKKPSDHPDYYDMEFYLNFVVNAKLVKREWRGLRCHYFYQFRTDEEMDAYYKRFPNATV